MELVSPPLYLAEISLTKPDKETFPIETQFFAQETMEIDRQYISDVINKI